MRPWLTLLAVVLSPTAHAVTLTSVDVRAPWPGVIIETWRAEEPGTDVYAVHVDLCADGIHVQATDPPSGLQTSESVGLDLGAELVVNGDFYKTGPTRVYGQAIGDGVPWPLDQTGDDPGYSWEWYYGKYGWIALGHDEVWYTHTEQTKTEGLYTDGWMPSTVQPDLPLGALSLVSGFPELVVEGDVVTCTSPTDSSCFPDRSDMRDRHPRTAMGLTADLQTLILVVADGRTSSNGGLYGSELADIMGQLGAWQAYNLDGGGSSQLWRSDLGFMNDASGNNYGSGARAVGNHWVIQTEGDGDWPDRPGHCVVEPACEELPPEGGVIDDDSDCFFAHGPSTWWREEADGEGGHLYWTNAFSSEVSSNWAWWQIETEEAGEYELEVYIDDDWGVYDAARYDVVVEQVATEVILDQGAASGWTSLGTFELPAGGGSFVALYDDYSGTVAADQHLVADALRLTRLDLPQTGDTGTPPDPGEPGGSVDPTDHDTATPGGTTPGGQPTDTTGSGPSSRTTTGGPGGCAVAPHPVGGWWFLLPWILLTGRGSSPRRAARPRGR